MTGTAAPWNEVAIESMSSAEPSTKIASAGRRHQAAPVVGRRIDMPVVTRRSTRATRASSGSDDAHRNVAITATIGDAHRHESAASVPTPMASSSPGRQRVEEGRRRGFGLVCPGDTDGGRRFS
jgi:hypothetical protein